MTAPNSHPNNLPAQLTSFVGRADLVAELTATVAAERLVTLTGIGGTGKTRLGLRVAVELDDHHPDGTWFVELAPVTDAALVLQAVASAVGVPPEPDRPLLDTLQDRLRGLRTLILLDNCEHVLASISDLTRRLLESCPVLRILATSREALGITGEVIRQVPSLAVPPADAGTPASGIRDLDAVRLFIERAEVARPGFIVDDQNADAVAQIVRRLDGIPLAIELAAARVRVMAPQSIADRLDDRFRLLTGGSRTLLPRQQTLEALIDWSHDLLDEPERTVLRRVSAFVGGFSRAAAEELTAGNGVDRADVGGLLDSLVEKSLVAKDPETGRCHQLETVRQYGRARLAEAGESDAVRDRHATWYRDLVTEAAPHVRSGRQHSEWLDRLDAEYENVRAGLEWLLGARDSAADVTMASDLVWFWYLRGMWDEGSEWLRRAEELASSPSPERVAVLNGAALLTRVVGDLPRAEELANEALKLSRELDDDGAAAFALIILAWTAWRRGGTSGQMADLAAESLALAEAAGAEWNAALARVFLGLGQLDLRDFSQADDLFTNASDHFEAIGDRWGIALAATGRAYKAVLSNDYERAMELLRESKALSEELGDQYGVGTALTGLGYMDMYNGNFEAALAHFKEAIVLHERVGPESSLAFAEHSAGLTALGLGLLDEAADWMEKAAQRFRTMGDPRGMADSQSAGGRAEYQRGNTAAAGRLFADSLDARHEIGDAPGIGYSLMGLAMVAARNGDLERGARLMGAVNALREHRALEVSPVDAAEEAHFRETLRAAFLDRNVRAGPGAAERALTEAEDAGRVLAIDEAIAEAQA